MFVAIRVRAPDDISGGADSPTSAPEPKDSPNDRAAPVYRIATRPPPPAPLYLLPQKLEICKLGKEVIAVGIKQPPKPPV